MRNKYSVAIVGFGCIGRRHFEALNKINQPIEIQIVDPNQDALNQAQHIVNQYKDSGISKTTWAVYKNLTDLKTPVDLAIVATHSLVRFDVFSYLVQNLKVKRFILEKILFPIEEQYAVASQLIDQFYLKVWVNCYLRPVPFFQSFKKELTLNSPLKIFVSGKNWGMATNSIHFVDLLAFLIEDADLMVQEIHLSSEILPSKREGFYEFSGRMVIKSKRGDTIDLSCQPGDDKPMHLRIAMGDSQHQIELIEDYAVYKKETSGDVSIEKVSIPFQSDMTHRHVVKILKEDQCDLVEYAESLNLHLMILKIFRDHWNQCKRRESLICPIT